MGYTWKLYEPDLVGNSSTKGRVSLGTMKSSQGTTGIRVLIGTWSRPGITLIYTKEKLA